MKKFVWMFLFIVFCFVLLSCLCCKLSNEIKNLQKVADNQIVINNRLVREIEETKDQNKRYLDTCLGLISSWEDGE